MSWLDVGPLDGLPPRGARVVRVGVIDIAVFRTGEGQVFALRDQCPHRGGPLSQGIVHGYRVTCPLHEWVIDLRSGSAVGADTGDMLLALKSGNFGGPEFFSDALGLMR